MKNSKKTNHAAYLSLCKEVESLELRTMFLDTVLAELFDEESDSFDLDAAGAVLSELENVVFQLRVAMFTAQNSDLPDNDGGLMGSITGLALDVCDMRDALMDVLDDILADADDAFAEAAAEAEVVDCFLSGFRPMPKLKSTANPTISATAWTRTALSRSRLSPARR